MESAPYRNSSVVSDPLLKNRIETQSKRDRHHRFPKMLFSASAPVYSNH